MAVTKKNIINKLYVVFIAIGLFMLVILGKLISIQYVKGDYYRGLSQQLTLKNDTIYANRGNVFADDGSLLATSKSVYEIRMDAVTVNNKIFNKNIRALSKKLAGLLGQTPSYWETKIKKARANRNRYLFIARGLGYLKYMQIKQFPIFNLGMYKGGFIAEQSTVRAHPLGKVAERTIGYDDYRGGPGIEGAYRKYLRGKYGWRMKQKIAKGQWRPISDNNEKDPVDGKDIITTLNVNIQDIAHHSLLKQLEYYHADHGCVVVMDCKTGEIKAISNLGVNASGKYYEKRNYAVYEIIEPGSSFKLMSLVAALNLKAIDTSTIVDTKKGKYKMYGRYIHDSKRGGHGVISAAEAFEVSSNIGFARLIDEHFNQNPNKFINELKRMHLDKQLGLPIKGEGEPFIPSPGDKKWSKNALPSIAYGYNLELTPLQILTFYNAIANNGIMVKPKFVKAIKSGNKNYQYFNKQVIDNQICSSKVISEVHRLLENVVKYGTGKKLYTPNFSMAGKTGTARTEYWKKDWSENKKYISSFTGYFPAKNPKYSCIVVIHKPKVQKGYYGADVSGPVFKDIAQKIYSSNPNFDKIETSKLKGNNKIKNQFNTYYTISNKAFQVMPNLKGMAAMDAIPFLENLGLKVQCDGVGKVKEQSIKEGAKIRKGQKVILKLTV
ncbi:MAG: penicillin-binding protein [Lutibacter sp.]